MMLGPRASKAASNCSNCTMNILGMAKSLASAARPIPHSHIIETERTQALAQRVQFMDMDLRTPETLETSNSKPPLWTSKPSHPPQRIGEIADLRQGISAALCYGGSVAPGNMGSGS